MIKAEMIFKMRKILILVAVFWMLLIFSMSAKSGEESGGLSEKVCRVICQIAVKDYDKLPENIQMEYIEKIHYPVRKLAHMTEYGILSMLYWGIAYSYEFAKRKSSLIAVAGAFLYACTDELHQLFVSGRGASFIDVIIDTTGATLGVLFILCITRLIEIKCKQNASCN